MRDKEPCRIMINAQGIFSEDPSIWRRKGGSIKGCPRASACPGEDDCPFLAGNANEEVRRIGIKQGVEVSEPQTQSEKFYGRAQRSLDLIQARR